MGGAWQLGTYLGRQPVNKTPQERALPCFVLEDAK